MRKLQILNKELINDDFLLQSHSAKTLYHEFAKHHPIIDYHSHLSPKDIAEDRKFETITQLWLDGDHYKWRAMRANGVSEEYCTGNASDKDKFIQWAATVPYTITNPLFHWTHLELKRYFGISDLLNKGNASRIYDQCNEMLKSPEYSSQGLLAKMNVELVCTTDDPADTLEYHQVNKSGLKVVPGFRPDKAIASDSAYDFNQWIGELENVSRETITSFDDLVSVLKSRMNYFNSLGCKVSDHGLPYLYASFGTEEEAEMILAKLRLGKPVSLEEREKYASVLMHSLAKGYHQLGWVQQFHLGALRNNRKKLFNRKGADLGFDSIGDYTQAEALSYFLNRLDEEDVLGKTILYNLDPSQNEVFATMAANFNDGKVRGKMQYGPAWWFQDQKDGIMAHLKTVSNYGLLTNFVGMVTDSRSFLSFTRHEYFRRILCDYLGQQMEAGELPEEFDMIGKVVEDICYNNAKNYFNF